MFSNLRKAFREAVENFYAELNRDQVPEALDELYRGMGDELVQARARLSQLREELDATTQSLQRERRELETCRRRERLAREIEDHETAAIASDFADKHERRVGVLEGKEEALTREIRLLEDESAEMLRRMREARAQRDQLAAQVGRASARDTLQGPEGLFQELDRMAEEIARQEALGDAMGEVADLERPERARGDGSHDAADLDRRLQELKERMRKP